MLGTDLCEVLAPDHDVLGVDLQDFDLTDRAATDDCLSAHRPDVVVHCAAWTDVDGCEQDARRAFVQNAGGTWNVASAAAGAEAAVIYVSTDYVFDGTKGEAYTEFDAPNPINVYGASKLAGEETVRRLVPRHYVVRSAWLYGARGRNFLKAILAAAPGKDELSVVADQFGSPTYTRDLAQAIAELLLPGRVVPGTYHLVNSGVCSWAELAAEALRLTGAATEVRPISTAEWSSPARRPPYSALHSRWLDLQDIRPLRSWQEAIASYIEEAV
jgi:dTDP-4-dehydrorhamnose reductase